MKQNEAEWNRMKQNETDHSEEILILMSNENETVIFYLHNKVHMIKVNASEM